MCNSNKNTAKTDKKNNTESKKKYSAEYISYVEHGDSAIVFITRDIVKSINTNGKWVDVISSKGGRRIDDKWDFESFIVEIFPRKTKPVYPEYSSDMEKKRIQWRKIHG